MIQPLNIYFDETKNQIVVVIDNYIDPIGLDSTKTDYDRLVVSGQLESYVSGHISDASINSKRQSKLFEFSNKNPGFARVFATLDSLISRPVLIEILLPLVKDRRIKIVEQPMTVYDKFLFLDSADFKLFSESVRYRIEDLGGNLTVTNKGILNQFMFHANERSPNSIGSLDVVVPTNREQAAAFLQTHRSALLTPIYEYATDIQEQTITAVGQIPYDYSINTDWGSYIYTPNAACPFMLQQAIDQSNSFKVSGYVKNSLDLSQPNIVNFSNCPDNLKDQISSVILGIGLSCTFFNLSGFTNNGLLYATSVDLRPGDDYLGLGTLSIEECTSIMSQIFNVVSLD
jgi:hypothetical protein